MSYIKGENRNQQILFPSSIDEYVEASNPVRVIAAFVTALDFKELGFERAEAAETGRPGYDPKVMLGLLIWGHLNRIRSSRRLEKESQRNLEVIWLMENLRPDFKTIADFRKNNGEGIRQAVVRFRLWCIDEGLYGQQMVSVDGSKFKAVNSRGRNYNEKKLREIIKREQERVDRYLKDLEEADEQEQDEPQISAEELAEKIARIKEKLSKHGEMLLEMAEQGESQLSTTDRESRLMKSSNGGNEVGYNVQMVVDSKHKLIVEYEVTNEGNDIGQLGVMAVKAKEALSVNELTVIADGGYFESQSIKKCEEAAITTYLPRPKSNAESRGVFGTERFSYENERDVYLCPEGKELSYQRKGEMNNKDYRIYRCKSCKGCVLWGECTRDKAGRMIRRWVYEPVLERLRERSRDNPQMMKERKKLAEHPFGTIKRAMDQGYFLLKGIRKVSTEMSLTVLAYNIKRAISILGVERMVASLQQAAG